MILSWSMQNDSYLDAMLDARSMPTCALQLRQRSTYEQHHRNTSAAVPDITVADILIPRRCPSAPPALRPATLILPSPHNRMAQFTPLRSPSDGPSVRPPPMKHRRPHGHPTLTFLPTHHASDIDPIDDFPRPRRLFFQAAHAATVRGCVDPSVGHRASSLSASISELR